VVTPDDVDALPDVEVGGEGIGVAMDSGSLGGADPPQATRRVPTLRSEKHKLSFMKFLFRSARSAVAAS